MLRATGPTLGVAATDGAKPGASDAAYAAYVTRAVNRCEPYQRPKIPTSAVTDSNAGRGCLRVRPYAAHRTAAAATAKPMAGTYPLAAAFTPNTRRRWAGCPAP